jgi:hypothetical protein
MMIQHVTERHTTSNSDDERIAAHRAHIAELSAAYELGYRDGRRDEKHRPGDKVLRMFNSYSS